LEGQASIENNRFVWRMGRAEVALARDGEYWSIAYTSTGKLLGPRQVIYEAKHKNAKHAAWDVMARVIRVSSDEDQGLLVARSAAQWMRSTGISDVTDD
jgi:hypothetical protein